MKKSSTTWPTDQDGYSDSWIRVNAVNATNPDCGSDLSNDGKRIF